MSAEVPAQPRRATEPLRAEHAELARCLGEVGAMIGALATAASDQKRPIMARIVGALREHVLAHAATEEELLYPLIDRKAGGKYPFTAAMRREHEIIARRIALLTDEAENPAHDALLFARHADQLLGIIHAHVEDEEEVLLPILDATATDEEVRAALGSERAEKEPAAR